MRLWAVGAACAACVGGAAASLGQDLVHKAPPQRRPVMIYNATIHPVDGPVIENGFVMFTDGRVSGLGTVGDQFNAEKNKADGWEMVDATGRHVYPGLIAAYTQIGLTEVSAARATLDMTEVGQATPEVRAAVAVNPDSTLIPVTRSNGVLIAGVFPVSNISGQVTVFDGPGGIVPGRAAVMRMDGWTWEQMAITVDAGLALNWPGMRPVNAWWMNRGADDQRRESERTLNTIERLFDDAAAYRAALAADASHARDLRFDAMSGVLPGDGQKPVFILANDYDQIVAAVGFGNRHKLRVVIVGGMDAHLCAGDLKRHDIPVIITGVTRFPKRADGEYDEAFVLPTRLDAAGVRFCLANGDDTAHERNLPYGAGIAVAYGLEREKAVRAITLSAAEILGIADRYGSIAVDKSATLFIADADVLEVTTNIEHAWIDGRKIDLSNKQVELEKKYREKYRQLDGK